MFRCLCVCVLCSANKTSGDDWSTYSQVAIERTVFHKLGHNHERLAFSYNSFQVNNVWMLELAHYRGLDEEVQLCLIGGLRFERFNVDVPFQLRCIILSQQTETDVAKLAWSGKVG